jgi:hypothetical protein
MATAGRPIAVSEALWFLQAQFSKLSKSEISSLMSAFYTYEEVAAAKCLLFDFAKTTKADYVPVFTERKGANKTRATVDDLLGLYTLLDIHKVELPCYVVVDIRRVPAMDSKVDVDVSVVATLTALVNDLRQQVSALSDKVDELTSRHIQSAPAASTYVDNIQPVPEGIPMTAHDDTVPKSWASQAAALASNSVAFKTSAPTPHRMIKRGSGHSSEKVKAVPRYVTCFVGRLAMETTAEDLCGYLADVGIKDARCRKLDDKDGYFRTAAFRVSCHDRYKDLFYNESNWPEGAEIRDWIFRRRDG